MLGGGLGEVVRRLGSLGWVACERSGLTGTCDLLGGGLVCVIEVEVSLSSVFLGLPGHLVLNCESLTLEHFEVLRGAGC